MRRFLLGIAGVVSLVAAPSVAYAQASIAGAVTDTSGGVLPGVTVEASSPALIERARTVVTDGAGQYRIVDLRAGTYTVTFSLPGFSTVVREGIELTGAFTATVDVELQVGGLEETITVTGQTPLVDVQSARRQQTLDSDVIDSIPSGRQYFSLTTLIPALNVQGNDVGGADGPIFSVFQIHGGRRNEGQVRVDGLNSGFQGMGVSYYVPDVGNVQEVSFSLSGGLGEAETGGPQMNIIPRQGGNTYSGSVFVNFANGSMQGDNFTQEVRDAGLRAPNQIDKLWDANGALGGPIARDRLWFYWTFRHQGNRSLVAGMWENLNAGDPTKWTYEPDYNNQAVDDGTWINSSLRLTWQASPRNKFSLWWDEQDACLSCLGGGTATTSPEADGRTEGDPQRMAQATWSSPVSSRLLLEASYGIGPDILFGGAQKNPYDRDLIRVQEQAGLIPGLNYRAAFWSRPQGKTGTTRASVSYVTGSHAAKVGLQYVHNWQLGVNFYNDQRLAYRFRNGVPNRLTQYGLYGVRRITRQDQFAVYAQDQWTRNRLTLQGGLRFEHIGSDFPEQQIGPDLYLPATLRFPAQDSGVSAKELMPRVGAAYDVFGDGRTALKASLGRYVTPENSYGIFGSRQNPTSRVAGSTNRSWRDLDGDYVPDCDLRNSAANGECGPWSNQSFGRQVFAATYDPAVLDGWGVREYSWDISVGVDHQLTPQVSVDVSYSRRIWGNFFVTDNRAVGPEDYDPYSITAPVDARLPNGGGYVIDDLYDISPAKFGQVDNFITSASNFGSQIRHYDGVDVGVNVRALNGLTLQGGFSTGRILRDDCDVTPKVDNPSRRFCHLQTPFLTQVKGLAAYTVPRVDVQVSGTFQSKPYVASGNPTIESQSLGANWVVLNSQIAPSLGRSLAGGSAVTVINLVEPGTLYGDRLNQIDFRVAKLLRYAGTRTRISLDIYNLFNSNTTESYQQTYGASWLNPRSITSARFAKISVQFDF